MKLSFAILAAIATIASAQQQRPSPPKQTQQRPPPPKQQQQNIALMEVWTGQKHEGSHHVSHGHPNQCYNLPEEWENKVSSAKAKQGYVCTLYSKRACAGEPFTFRNSQSMPKSSDNKASSWKCHKG